MAYIGATAAFNPLLVDDYIGGKNRKLYPIYRLWIVMIHELASSTVVHT